MEQLLNRVNYGRTIKFGTAPEKGSRSIRCDTLLHFIERIGQEQDYPELFKSE